MLRLIQRLLGYASKNQLPPFDFARNRYLAKRQWPPTLKNLSEKQQFRFERKFKRRLLLKSIRPAFQRKVKIATWSIISFVVVYSVLFHDFKPDPMMPSRGEQPFDKLRAWMWKAYDDLWTHSSIQGAHNGTQLRMRARTEEEVQAELDAREATRSNLGGSR